MTPEARQRVRVRAMKECPHWAMGDAMPRPCLECELDAAVAEEREAWTRAVEQHACQHGTTCIAGFDIPESMRARA